MSSTTMSATMNMRNLLHVGYPNLSFILLATVLSTISSQLTPSAIPIILNLATLLVYSQIFLPKPGALKNASLLLVGLSVGSSIPKLPASWSALSSAGISILVLLLSSSITSFFVICAVVLDSKTFQRSSSPWTRTTAFPALWASLWSAVAYVSPIGRLSAWSPMHGAEAYSWLVPLLGPAAIDWVLAAWAVFISQEFAAWFMNENDDEVAPLVSANGTATHANHTGISRYLAIILAALAVPSLFSIDHPLPINSPNTTPLSVGCVLPPFRRYQHHTLTFDDYFDESKKLTMSARLLLWPESAVIFHNESERNDAFARVRKNITGSYVGVSFEEIFPDPNDTTGTKGARRNGMALISQHSEEPHLVYYKRKLVPIAESFSLTHSTVPPEMYTINLPRPKDVKKKLDWGPGPNHTRPISVTTSICLDFTDPSLFQDLPGRPVLILAPARTWNIDIGVAMWNQAKQRAYELDTMILWCDGGNGGVSGVAGQGYNDVQQVGEGSWVRTIAVDYPHKESRTIYAVVGGYNLLFFWLIALGSSVSNYALYILPGGMMIRRVHQIAISVMSYIKKRREGGIRLENEQEGPFLVDLEN